MSGTIQFNRSYAEFGPQVRPFEASTAVSFVLTGIMCEWQYPMNALIGCEFSAQWLGEGEKGPNDPEDLDLIFRMNATDLSDAYYEVILRDGNMVPTYGGWIVPANSIEVLDEIVNGYRVIVAKTNDGDIRHEFDPTLGVGGQYVPASSVAAAASALVSRRKARV